MEINPRRVLVLDTAWLGDIVFSTALLSAAATAWPEAELHALTSPRGAPLLENRPDLSALWVFDKRGADKSAGGLLRFGRRLAQARFDIVLNAHPSPRSRLLTWLTRAPVRVGYAGWGAHLCFTHLVPNDLAIEPDHVARRLALLKALGIHIATPALNATVSAAARQWAAEFRRRHNIGGIPLLGLVTGSAWPTKCWPAEHYAQLAERWLCETRGAVLLFGGTREAEQMEAIRCGNPRIAGVGGEEFGNVAALLTECMAVVGNDTGVSFLAMAAGAPRVVVLYGCTQVNYRFPPPHRALHAGVPCCLPRTGHGAHTCRWGVRPWCMEQLKPERVWAEIAPATA